MSTPTTYPFFEQRRAWFIRQIHAANIAARLDEIAAGFVTADAEAREELIAEAAELLTLDPDDYDPGSCRHIKTAAVSEWDDERNSRG